MTEPAPITHQQFYDLASVGVWSGIAVACLLAVLLGMWFVRAVW